MGKFSFSSSLPECLVWHILFELDRSVLSMLPVQQKALDFGPSSIIRPGKQRHDNHKLTHCYEERRLHRKDARPSGIDEVDQYYAVARAPQLPADGHHVTNAGVLHFLLSTTTEFVSFLCTIFSLSVWTTSDDADDVIRPLLLLLWISWQLVVIKS